MLGHKLGYGLLEDPDDLDSSMGDGYNSWLGVEEERRREKRRD